MIAALDGGLGGFAAVLIVGYQRFLSPRKGYACAHRLRHGGESCSEHARRVFARDGWRAGLACLGPRFRDCRAARWSLLKEQWERDEFFDDFDPGEGKGRGRSQDSSPCGLQGETCDGAEFCLQGIGEDVGRSCCGDLFESIGGGIESTCGGIEPGCEGMDLGGCDGGCDGGGCDCN